MFGSMTQVKRPSRPSTPASLIKLRRCCRSIRARGAAEAAVYLGSDAESPGKPNKGLVGGGPLRPARGLVANAGHLSGNALISWRALALISVTWLPLI